jgi:amino acid transporter, AAT family
MVGTSLVWRQRVITNRMWDASVPWDYPDLSNKSIVTSPFTLVFARAGSSMCAL